MSRAPRWWLHWLPAFAYMALIFVLSSFALSVPSIESVPMQDKGVHFVEYLVLGLLCAHACLHTWPDRAAPRTIALGAFLAAAWGLSDELHQAFVPGRSADVYDFVADACGASVGALLRGGWRWVRARRSPELVGSSTEEMTS